MKPNLNTKLPVLILLYFTLIINATAQTRLNDDLVLNGNVLTQIKISSTANRVVYIADQNQNGFEELVISYLSMKERLTITDISGRVLVDEMVDFRNGSATVKSAFQTNSIYIIRLNQEAIKFKIR